MEKRIVLELRGEERAQCTSLDLSGCKTGGEWEGLTEEFKSLKELDLKNSSLTHIKLFPKLPSLTKLDLSENRLSKGLEVLKDSLQLEFLSINDNKFKEVSSLEPLKTLTKLSHLDIQGNEFEEEDHRAKVFELLPHVQFIDGKDKDGNDEEDSDDDEGEEEDEEDEESGEEEDSSGEEEEPGLSALYNNTELLDEDDADFDEAAGEQEQEGDDDVEEEESDDDEGEARGEKRKLEGEEEGEGAAKK